MKQTGLPLLASGAFVALCFSIVWMVRRHGLLRAAEFEVHDRLLAHRVARHQASASDVPRCIIVAMTEDDIDRWRDDYPMSDRKLAALLKRIVDGEPIAVGVDLFRDFSIPSRHATTQEVQADRDDLETIINNPQVSIVMPHLIGEGPTEQVTPPKFFRNPLDSDHQGFVDVKLDEFDGMLRRAFLLRRNPPHQDAKIDPSMALQLARAYLDNHTPPVEVNVTADGIQLGKSMIHYFHGNDGAYVNAEDADGQILLDDGGPRSFTTFSIEQVLSPAFDPHQFRNAIVLVGPEARSVKDDFLTPLGSEPGVVMHARIVDQLIRAATIGDASINVIGMPIQMMLLASWCVVGGLIGFLFRSYLAFFAIIGSVIVLSAALAVVSMSHGLWIPMVPPLLGFSLSAGSVTVYMSYRERLDRLAMMQLFERSVSGPVAKAIWQRRDEIFEDGRLRTRETCATVLFTDIVQFSAVAERLNANELIDWLNEYFQKISDLVCKWGGNINKFNGDQIVAVFGPPLERTESQANADAQGAVSCAVEMRDRLQELNSEWLARHMPQIKMRIGVHSGTLVAGSLGSRDRQEWTVIGDTVNIASRLESFDKDEMSEDIACGGCRILISGSTLRRIPADRLASRYLGAHELTGRQQKVDVHGVVDFKHSPVADLPSRFKPVNSEERPTACVGR